MNGGEKKMADGKIVIKIDMDKSDFENNGDKVIKINVNTNGSDENEEELKTAAESGEEGAGARKKRKKEKRKWHWPSFWFGFFWGLFRKD
mgnify:CR=1 FL=1